VVEANAVQIFEQVEKFAGYGFNKSHAAAYALVAYQTAWLKTNYPVEFFAASMTLDLGNTDKLNIFKQELDRLKIKLLPPDINRSRAAFAVEELPDGTSAIRYALAAIKNVGRGAMEDLVSKRAETGRFKDIFDFTGRLDAQMVNKRQLENLVCAGAMDGIAPNRRQAFDAIELILRHAHSAASDRDSPQENLFGGIDSGPKHFALPVVEDWPVMERLRHEFEAIGFYLSAHPLDAYSASLRRLDAVKFGDLPAWLTGRPNTRAKMAGVVVSKQERTSARGNRFAFVQFSDASGIYEAMVFSELLGASRELLVPGTMVFLTADARTEGDIFRLNAQTIRPLDEAVAGAAAGLRIFLREPEALDGIKTIIQRDGRGKGKVSLVLELDRAREVEVTLPGTWMISAGTRQAIKSLPLIVDVQDV